MARFIFKMQSILTIKEKLEEQARMDYALANARLREKEEQRDAVIRRRDGYLEEAVRLRSEILDPVRLSENEAALRYMKQALERAEKAVLKARAEVDLAREKLQEAIKERKIYEKLKERAFEAFKEEVNKAENKEVDELVSYVYGRRAMQGEA